MEHQKVSTSQFTEYYLVNLLASCVNGERPPGVGVEARHSDWRSN